MDTITIPEGLSDAQLWALIVGFVSPLILNFIISATWSKATKALVAFGVSAVLGVVTSLVTGAYDGLSIVSSLLLTAVVATTSYQTFWSKVAPNMQRNSAEKTMIVHEQKVAEIDSIAAATAAAVVTQKLEELPVAQAEYVDPEASREGHGPGLPSDVSSLEVDTETAPPYDR